MKASEMIAMLEKNPKLKFRQSYTDPGKYLVVSAIGNLIWIKEGETCGDRALIGIHDDWVLVREPVPVWEAIKAWTEGKMVTAHIRTSDHSGSCFQLTPNFSKEKEIPLRFLLQGEWFIQ